MQNCSVYMSLGLIYLFNRQQSPLSWSPRLLPFCFIFFFVCSRGDWVEGVRRGSWGGGRMHALSIFKTLSLLLSQQPRLPTPLSCPAYPAALRIFGRCCCCRCVLNKSLLNFIFSSQFDVRVVADILQAPRPQPAGQQIVCPIYVGKRC